MANTKKYISLDKLGVYDEKIKGVISAGDTATLNSAKEYANSLATNYDAAGAAATVQGELDKEVIRAKAREDEIAGLVATAQGEVDALEGVVATKAAQADLDALSGKVGNVPEGSTVMGIITNIQESAYDDTALRAEIDGKLALKADKTQVATDIENAVKAEEDARKEAVAGVQSAVDTLSGTHATDKAALEGAIALKADQSALEAVSAVADAAVKQADYDVKVKALEDEDARIVGLVEAEATKAREEEGKLEDRIETMEAFWAAAQADGDEGNVIDTLKEIQEYIASDETGASEMLAAINKNKEDIAAHVAVNHDFAGADAALKSELEGKINAKADSSVVEAIDGRVEVLEGEMDAVEGRATSLEGRMTTVEGEVATKAEAQALADAVAALEGADNGLSGRISAIEAKFEDGEGSVEDQIAAAKQEAIDAAAEDATTKANKALEDAKKYADDEDAKIEERVGALETASATHALASDLTALTGRVTTAEGEIDTLQTEMDAVEALAAANKAAHEANAAAIALKASQDDLNAVSDRVTALETWHNNFTEASEEEINGLFE